MYLLYRPEVKYVDSVTSIDSELIFLIDNEGKTRCTIERIRIQIEFKNLF